MAKQKAAQSAGSTVSLKDRLSLRFGKRVASHPKPGPKLPPPSWAEFFRFLEPGSDELLSRDEAAELLELIFRYSQLDDSEKQAWLIDRTVRTLTGDRYSEFVATYSFDEDFGHSFDWNRGTDPRPEAHGR